MAAIPVSRTRLAGLRRSSVRHENNPVLTRSKAVAPADQQ
ncbi:hypothetical protein ASAP_0735 [Asaia bogorensis]|uniref:Uncharacterized protein n=1 Tax=Asaia bogorensis TaxID=91915 RepID=A0A060QD00_9PROT|nr:hypothetical protein ASAP_0735 [Asaia bogorensis]